VYTHKKIFNREDLSKQKLDLIEAEVNKKKIATLTGNCGYAV
jgi:hypothetical protein